MDGNNGQKDMDSGRRQVWLAFLAVLGSMVFGGIGGAVIMLALVDPASPNLDIPRWAIILSEALILLPLSTIVVRRGMSLPEAYRLRPVTSKTLRDTVFIGLGLTILVDELDRLVATIFPLPENIARGMEFLAFSSPVEALLVILGAVLLAPLVEEIVFRGFFQGQLERGYRDPTKAILFSSLLFTIMHFNPWWSLQIYLLGMVLGYLAWRTGSIWPSFVIHALNNALALWFANAPEESFAWYAPNGHVFPLWLLAAGILVYMGFKSLLVQIPEPLLSDR
ncbi:lysostaphin resistance A-like protein [Candidatus Neomarinimicrobiota bacterium]